MCVRNLESAQKILCVLFYFIYLMWVRIVDTESRYTRSKNVDLSQEICWKKHTSISSVNVTIIITTYYYYHYYYYHYYCCCCYHKCWSQSKAIILFNKIFTAFGSSALKIISKQCRKWQLGLFSSNCYYTWVMIFLQRVRIAYCTEPCTSYARFRPSYHPSDRLSHAGTVSKRLKLRSCGLQ